MFINDLQLSNLHSPNGEQRLLFQEQLGQIKLKQQNIQDRMNSVLQQVIQKLRKYTKIKNISLLTKQQLQAFNDLSTNQSLIQEKEKVTSQFEKQYYQYKQQSLSLQYLVSSLVALARKQQSTSLKPSHPMLIFWSFIKFLLVLHLCFVFPLSDSFVYQLDDFIHQQSPLFFIEIVILTMDMILRLNVQIYQNGILITETKKIIKQYFRNEFLNDFLGLIGLIAFILSAFTPLKYIFVLKIKELSNFMEVFKYEIDPNGRFKNHLKLLTLLITVVLLAHCFACIWIGIGQHSTSDNWIVARGLADSNWIEIYLNGLYFAITTMTTVGYGDITPINRYEVLLSICLTLFSSCIFAYVFNTITSILKDLDADKSKVKHDLEILSLYMKKRNIDTDLQKRVENYLRLVYQHQPSTQEKKIFSKLSPSLKQEINEQDKGLLLLKQPTLVNNFSFKLMRELIECVQEINLTPKEKLQNELGLHILMKGDLKLFYGDNRTEIGCLKPGDSLGMKCLFNIPFDKRIQSVSEEFSTLYLVTQNDFFKRLKDTDLDQFYQIKDKVNQLNFDNLYQKCFLCRKQGHEMCEDIIYTINKELILAKHTYTTQQIRKNDFNRKKQKKSRALQDLEFKRRSANLCYQRTIKTIRFTEQHSDDDDEEQYDMEDDSYDELELSKHYLDENKETISVSFDKTTSKVNNKKDQLQSYRTKMKGNSIVRMLQNYTSQKVWHDELFIVGDFDKMRIYRMYYPTQNYDQVVKYYNHLRKKQFRTIYRSLN